MNNLFFRVETIRCTFESLRWIFGFTHLDDILLMDKIISYR